mgnify:CR=1 FL=1
MIPPEDPTNYRRIITVIRRLWAGGEVQFSPHAAKRMRRRSLDVNYVQHIIRYGAILSHSPPAGKTWRYVIEGATDQNKTARCVATIEGRLLIITVTRKDV